MFKRLAIVALLIMLHVQPLQPQGPAQPGNHAADAKTDQTPEPIPPAVVKVDNHVDCSECAEKDSIAAQDPDKWVRRGFDINAILLVVTLVIAIATFIQALAAKTTAKAQMDSDRAWILVKVRTESREPHTVINAVVSGVFCEVEIVGNTPARVLSEKYRCRAVPRAKEFVGLAPELESVPVYLPENEYRRNPIFLAPGDKSPRHMRFQYPEGSSGDDPVSKITMMEWVLCVYGRVEYEDAFRRKAVTQFCAVYYPRLGSVALGDGAEVKIGGFGIDGPEGYNYNT